MATREKTDHFDKLYKQAGQWFTARSAQQRKIWRVDSQFPSKLSELPMTLSGVYADPSLLAWPDWITGFGVTQVTPDLPNCRGYYYATTNPWDARLYAGVYAAFVEKARQGNAELGMNLVTYRQALKTFCQVSITALATVQSLYRAHRIAFALIKERRWNDWSDIQVRSRRSYLLKVRLRDQAQARRVRNELYALDKVSALFLAWRYGVKPLMDDLYNAASVLSGETKDVISIRKSMSARAASPWIDNLNGREDSYEWSESCTLRGTATVTNPNLHLANRLGLINPQLWVWDMIPFSFIVDWWFPVGSFLGNFTALAGLSLSGTSVTRSRRGTTFHRRWGTQGNGQPYNQRGSAKFVYKKREVGSLPFPTSVPYGTGLGINRAQNALALLTQFLSKKIVK